MLTTAEAAKVLGVAKGTLEFWRHKRTGPPFYMMGGRVRYSREDLEAWTATRRQEPTQENPLGQD